MNNVQVTETMLFDYDTAVNLAFDQIKGLMEDKPFHVVNVALDAAIHRHLSDKYSVDTIKLIDSKYLQWLERNDVELSTPN